MFHIPVEEKLILGAYPINYDFPLIEADFVNPDSYRTDLKEFFQAMQCRQDKKRLMKLLRTERFQNLNTETEQVIAVHLNMKGLIKKMEKEKKPMCKAVQDWIEDERNKGRREGIMEGEKKGMKKGMRKGKKEEKILVIRRMRKEGLEENVIRRVTKCTKAEFAAAIGK